MITPNAKNEEQLEKEVEKKYAKKGKRKRPKMKVSGAGVRGLEKIMGKQKT